MEHRSLWSISIALIVSTLIGAVAWSTVKTSRQSNILVTGSAKKRITSDLILWDAVVTAEASDRVESSRALKKQVQKTVQYLKSKGLTDAEIHTSAVVTRELMETQWTGMGESRTQKTVSRGWEASQTVHARSSDVPKVERVSTEVTDLLEEGVPIVSHAPAYLYTKLGELKIEMLATASRDARTRAEKMIEAAGGSARLGSLESIDMGVINVNPADSTETSWEGNNDTTSREKDIITIIHAKYRIK